MAQVLSDYELMRLANIQRNEAVMAALGLATRRASPRKRKRKLQRIRAAEATGPRRRSSRIAKVDDEAPATFIQEVDEPTFVAREPAPLSSSMSDTALKAVYSLSARGDVVAAGGKAGQVSVFGRPASFRAGKGWIGGVSLLDEARLLCCGNDGFLRLFDCSVASEDGTPRLVASARPHASGVWSLAVDEVAATGAKDGCVQIYALDLATRVASVETPGPSVKCVALRRGLMGVAAADGDCVLYDRATYTRTVSFAAHEEGATAIAFGADGNAVLTAGFEDVRLWDLRKLDGEVSRFDFPDATAKISTAIRRPEFISPSKFVVAGRDAPALAIYDVGNSASETLALPQPATALAKHPDRPLLYVGLDARPHATVSTVDLAPIFARARRP